MVFYLPLQSQSPPWWSWPFFLPGNIFYKWDLTQIVTHLLRTLVYVLFSSKHGQLRASYWTSSNSSWLPDHQMCGSCWKWMVALSRRKFLCTAPWEESETLMRLKVLPVRWVEIQNKKSSSWDWGQQCFHLRKAPEFLESASIHCQKIVLSSTWSNMKSHPCISQTASLSLPNPWKTARPTLLRYSTELNRYWI